MPLFNLSRIFTGRQNDTTNSIVNNRIESGWGVMTPGAGATAAETVTFQTAFNTAPIVVISYGGDNASATTYGSGGNTIKQGVAEAVSITTTGFSALVTSKDTSAWAAGNTVFYQWIAIGS